MTQRNRVYQTCAAFGKLAFAPVRKSPDELLAHQQFEDGIVQEFELLVVPRGIFRGALGDTRAVSQGLQEPSGVAELMAENRLQIRKLTHLGRHKSLPA